LKYQYSPQETKSGLVRNLFSELNGQAFLAFIEELTGIDNLIPDPYFLGGGLHETRRGGHLGVHADFNLHHKMGIERRLNLLIYLNDAWMPEFGGNLELWDKEMKGCQVSIPPKIGTAVLFSTNLDSFHGHPEPLSCPEDTTRRSIATYYYTALPAHMSGIPERDTNFRVRPGSQDRIDWLVRRAHFISDWVPPRLQSAARKLLMPR
jgi:Rps23 Pro-64 3,4-dihydroxylase Tpa1-like proline 4-hydroxylase